MASRYIKDENFEIQIQNCFSSMLDAIESHHPFNRITALSKNDIVGLRLLEFNNFDSRLRDGQEIRADYQNTYRINGRFTLMVSGEYSNDCLTVLLMITDRQTKARFGFKAKIAANRHRKKTLHIITKIPIFGVHCVINYNPDKNFYVFSIRPPLTDIDFDLENTDAKYNECALICLELDFVRGSVSYEVHNYGNESPFNIERSTSVADESIYKEFKKLFKINSSLEYESDSDILSDFQNYQKTGVIPIMETKTLSFGNKNANVNVSCTYRKLFENGRFNSKSLSGGFDFTKSLNDSFDLTVGGEYCDGTITVPLMITHKKSGFSFGIEVKLSCDPKKRGANIVLKIPIDGYEIPIKVGVVFVAGVVVKLASVFFKSKKNNGKKGGGKKGGGAKGNDESNNVNSDDAKDDDHVDEKCAAAMGCDLICVEVDFLTQTVALEVYEYETIKGYAPSIEITKDEKKLLLAIPEKEPSNREKEFRHPEEQSFNHEKKFYHQEEYTREEEFHPREEEFHPREEEFHPREEEFSEEEFLPDFPQYATNFFDFVSDVVDDAVEVLAPIATVGAVAATVVIGVGELLTKAPEAAFHLLPHFH